MNIIEIFSKNLKKYRLEKKLSQEKLAELCSFNRTYISSLERGLRSPSLKSIEIISNILETDTYLFFIE
ncbi:helix-turn-helix transcriptional regulator [Fusobacterium polymorphum]|uniref:helix-turn-helix domain-containing protein n=1 Tax=Fusobacterium nucleatum subsp. polymorphum TaxID=76857 RepID=UPI003009694A